MVRIAIVGNCQARPIAEACRHLAPRVEVLFVGIIHLASATDEATFAKAYEAADIIFAQLTADTYPLSFVRTSTLKAQHPGKIIVWPNLFFRGQCPDLYYATGEGRQRVSGPLGDYHSRTILEMWRAGRPAAEAIARLEAGDLATEQGVAERSLAQLRQREASTDVAASDLIAASWARQRLFFTFNHPRSILLEAISRRLLAAAGIEVSGLLPPRFGEPLGQIVPPLTAGMRAALGLDFPDGEEVIRGVPWPAEALFRRVTYSLPDLVETFYRAYDSQAAVLESARLS